MAATEGREATPAIVEGNTFRGAGQVNSAGGGEAFHWEWEDLFYWQRRFFSI